MGGDSGASATTVRKRRAVLRPVRAKGDVPQSQPWVTRPGPGASPATGRRTWCRNPRLLSLLAEIAELAAILVLYPGRIGNLPQGSKLGQSHKKTGERVAKGRATTSPEGASAELSVTPSISALQAPPDRLVAPSSPATTCPAPAQSPCRDLSLAGRLQPHHRRRRPDHSGGWRHRPCGPWPRPPARGWRG